MIRFQCIWAASIPLTENQHYPKHCVIFLRGKKMRISLRAMTAVVAMSAVMASVSVVPSFAQSSTTEIPAKPKPVPHKRHIFHKGIGSATSRNVGPASSATGTPNTGTGLGNANSGNPIVPGAPSAGPTNGGGH